MYEMLLAPKIVGFDGGQRQWFRIEITDQKTGILIANLSSSQPTFAVNGLESELLLKIAVMAVNSKGASDRVILEAYTLKAPEKRLGKWFAVYLWPDCIILPQNLSDKYMRAAKP